MPESPYSSERMTQAPGTRHFMPPEALVPQWVTIRCVLIWLCVISQQWPIPKGKGQAQIDPNTDEIIALTEVERRQRYTDQINDGSLKQLVMSCLDNDQGRRPPISQVYGRITRTITGELTSLYCIV